MKENLKDILLFTFLTESLPGPPKKTAQVVRYFL